MKKAFGVYILQSLKNSRYYIGSTDDMNRRLTQHNKGYVKSTENMRPWKLKAFVKKETLQEARKAELRLKRYKSRVILEKVISDGVLPWDFKNELKSPKPR